MGNHAAGMGKKRYAYRILLGKSKGKRSLRISKLRLDDNIKMDLREIG
jgi:hypothetical protein